MTRAAPQPAAVGTRQAPRGEAAAAVGGAARPRTPALPRDWTSTWIVVITAALMSFLASFSQIGAAGLEKLAESWTVALSQRATVEIEVDGADVDLVRRRAVDVISETPGVASARALDDLELQQISRAFLGDDAALLSELPPVLMIDVALERSSLDPEGARALARLQTRLSELRFAASVDSHERWLARLTTAAAWLRALAWALLLVVVAATVLMNALACLTSLAAQSHVIDVLKLVGARDRYIIGLFVRRFQILSFVGSAIGVGAAAALLIWSPLSAEPESVLDPGVELAPFLPSFQPDAIDWAQLALTPLGFALIATAAAHVAVATRLRARAS